MKVSNEMLLEQINKSGEITQVHVYKAATATEARLLERLSDVADKSDVESSAEDIKAQIAAHSGKSKPWSVLQFVIFVLVVVAGFFIGYMFSEHMVAKENGAFVNVVSTRTQEVRDNKNEILFYREVATYDADPVVCAYTIFVYTVIFGCLAVIVIENVNRINAERDAKKPKKKEE